LLDVFRHAPDTLEGDPHGALAAHLNVSRALAKSLNFGLLYGMQAPGFAEVDRAKQDGRWEAAYESPRAATVPKDLQTALKSSPQANAFFRSLNSRNRFAILFRIQTAKKPATRARRIEQFIQMLENHGKLYP
jgi:uncharacterized protein YdeI (YjbR/CyaY-like superfamily)